MRNYISADSHVAWNRHNLLVDGWTNNFPASRAPLRNPPNYIMIDGISAPRPSANFMGGLDQKYKGEALDHAETIATRRSARRLRPGSPAGRPGPG